MRVSLGKSSHTVRIDSLFKFCESSLKYYSNARINTIINNQLIGSATVSNLKINFFPVQSNIVRLETCDKNLIFEMNKVFHNEKRKTKNLIRNLLIWTDKRKKKNR